MLLRKELRALCVCVCVCVCVLSWRNEECAAQGSGLAKYGIGFRRVCDATVNP